MFSVPEIILYSITFFHIVKNTNRTALSEILKPDVGHQEKKTTKFFEHHDDILEMACSVCNQYIVYGHSDHRSSMEKYDFITLFLNLSEFQYFAFILYCPG